MFGAVSKGTGQLNLRRGERIVQVWWHKGRRLSDAEKWADGAVHVLGLLIALLSGTALLTAALLRTAPAEFPALVIYVLSLVALLSISLAFNMWPRTPIKQV